MFAFTLLVLGVIAKLFGIVFATGVLSIFVLNMSDLKGPSTEAWCSFALLDAIVIGVICFAL